MTKSKRVSHNCKSYAPYFCSVHPYDKGTYRQRSCSLVSVDVELLRSCHYKIRLIPEFSRCQREIMVSRVRVAKSSLTTVYLHVSCRELVSPSVILLTRLKWITACTIALHPPNPVSSRRYMWWYCFRADPPHLFIHPRSPAVCPAIRLRRCIRRDSFPLL